MPIFSENPSSVTQQN